MAARSQTAPSLLASVWQMASSRTSPNTTDSLPSSRGSFKWPPLSPRLSRPRGWPCGRPSRGLSSDFRAHFHLLLDSPGTIGRASLRTGTLLPDLPVLRVPISVSGAAVPPGPKSRSRLRTTLRPPHLVRWQLLLPINVKKRPQSCPLPFYGSHLGAGHSRPSQSGGTASCGHPAATLRGRSGLLKTALSSRGTPSRSPCARLLA